MIPEVTKRYEQRILILSIQLIKTLRRVLRNEWADYATLMIYPSLNALGHVNATEMYDALLSANRNGTPKIQATTYNNEGVYIRRRPYFQAQQSAAKIPSSHTSTATKVNLVRAEQPHLHNAPYRNRTEESSGPRSDTSRYTAKTEPGGRWKRNTSQIKIQFRAQTSRTPTNEHS